MCAPSLLAWRWNLSVTLSLPCSHPIGFPRRYGLINILKQIGANFLKFGSSSAAAVASKSVWLVFRLSWVRIPAGFLVFTLWAKTSILMLLRQQVTVMALSPASSCVTWFCIVWQIQFVWEAILISWFYAWSSDRSCWISADAELLCACVVDLADQWGTLVCCGHTMTVVIWAGAAGSFQSFFGLMRRAGGKL